MSDPQVTAAQATADKNAADVDAAIARFEGPYIEAADLMQQVAVVTIEAVIAPNTIRQKAGRGEDGKLIDKPILVIQGRSKQLILGKTNERIMKAVHGRKASGWVGKKVTLGVRYLEKAFGEKNVPTIRIIPPPEIPLPMGVRKFFGAEKSFTE